MTIKKTFLGSFLVLAFFTFTPYVASAATMSLTPGTQSIQVGNLATVRVAVNAGGTPINNAEATLDFPPDALQVVSVSKSGSVFSLWVEDPSYSNGAGTISFNGGLPTPGYLGSSGTVVSITFLTKKAGVASVQVRDAAVRANDGFGTDVLSGTSNAQVVITAAPSEIIVPTPTPNPPPGETPTAIIGEKIVITSLTHPDQNAWYSNRNPLLSWKLPAGVIAIQTLISENSPEIPTVTYRPGIVEKRIDELSDGSWYFSLRSRITATWGAMSTYRLQVDGTPPILAVPSAEFDIRSRTILISNISAVDVTSGIASFTFSVDGGASTTMPALAFASSTAHTIPFRGTSGNHQVLIAATDYAGNVSFAIARFAVTLPLGDQVVWTVFGIDITLFTFLLIVLLVALTALFVALTALFRTFREGMERKVQVGKRDKTLHRALTLFKEDMEARIKNLSHVGNPKELSQEGDDIRESLEGNVEDLERFLKKEIKKFD